MPEVPPTFIPGDESAGLELVDTTLWIAKRLQESKPLSKELAELFSTQVKRGLTDEVSLAGMDKRWRHIMYLPEPEKPLPEDLQEHLDSLEAKRKEEVGKLSANALNAAVADQQR